MPNDLKTQRNLLNSRPESRSESRSESQRQKLASSGFTASIWTLSGVVLVACSNVEDFLGLDDGGGGGGGGTLHVHSSPVQGARIYFDVDGGGVSDDEMAAQDAEHPQGFISNAEGRVLGVPNKFYGLPFEAHLDGAFDTDTGESLSGILHSIPNPNEENNLHTLASPITEYFSDTDLTVEQLMIDIEDILPAGATDAEINALLQQILDPTSYDGSSRIDGLAAYLANTQSPMQTEITRILLGDEASDNTLIVVNEDAESSSMDVINLPDVTISMADGSVLDSYVATIHAVGHGDPAVYNIVASAGSGAFTVNERGVITVRDGMTPTTTTLQIEVSSGTETAMVEVEVTVADALTLEEVDTGFVPTSIVENVAGAVGGTDLVAGITATGVTSPDWVIRAPGGFSDKFDVVDDSGNYKLVLKEGESLDYEAFSDSNGEFNVEVWAVEGGVRSNALTLTVMVTGVNEAPVFIFGTEDNEQKLVGDGGTIETLESARGMVARVRAVDADGDSVTYAITNGNVALLDGNGDPTGEMLFSIDGDGAITLNGPLDFETTETYTLTITATGLDANGDPDATTPDTAMVTITVTDINDESPTVTPTTGTGSVRITDGTPPATATNTGYTITVTDADASNDFAVSVRGDSRFDFVRQQNSDTWDLVLLANQAIPAAELNSEITLTYTVTDGGVGTTAATGTVSIDVVDSPVSFMPIADSTALMPNEGDAGWTLQVTATSMDTTQTDANLVDSPISGYEFVGDSDGFAISATGLITLTDALDYEAGSTHTLRIRATDSRTPMAEMGETSITINVQDVEEGSADYEITEDNAGTMLTVALVDSDPTSATYSEDPDGRVGGVSYQWFTTDGTTHTPITGATSATLDISNRPPGESYGVYIGYTDGFGTVYTHTDNNDDTTIAVLASSVSWDVVPSYDPVANPLTDGMAPMANDPVIPMTAISASGGDGKIEYSIEDPSGVFQIHPNSGALSVSENGPAVWDFETTPSYEIYIVATDVDDGGTMGTGDTARQRVVITVQDANDAPVVNDALQVNTASGAIGFGSQENLLVRGDDITAMLGSGITPITGATAGDDSALDGTAADEYIYGDAGDDTITGGGGTDHIIGGAGDDGITLASGSVETIYYRFSTTGFAPIASDGADTVTGFRRGEDRIVLLDTDSTTPFDRDTLLSDAQNAVIGSSTFSANPLFDVAITEATVKLTGFQIVFDDTFFTINYATDSEVTVRSGGNWLAAAVPYLGALDNMGVPEDFASGAGLRDNSLLLNYFMPSVDVLISEKRNARDGFFATVSATDPDGTAPNNEITRYDISGGTGRGVFVVNVMGEISVGDGTTLDYDTTSEYTLEITATDAGGAVSDPTTITIGLIENGEAEYSLALTGTTYTATRDTADPDGVDDTVDVTYQWYTTPDGGTTKNVIATSGTNSISDTTSETLDVMGYTPPSGQTYGVTITYTDGVGIDESVDAVLASVTLDDISRTSTADTTLPASASVHTLAPTVVGGGTVTYVLSGGDSSLFTEFQGKIFPMPTLTLTKTTYSFTITATEDVGGTSDTATFTLTTGYSEASPAIIPDRQAFAHQDPYEPNDDQNDQTNQDNPQTPPDIM